MAFASSLDRRAPAPVTAAYRAAGASGGAPCRSSRARIPRGLGRSDDRARVRGPCPEVHRSSDAVLIFSCLSTGIALPEISTCGSAHARGRLYKVIQSARDRPVDEKHDAPCRRRSGADSPRWHHGTVSRTHLRSPADARDSSARPAPRSAAALLRRPLTAERPAPTYIRMIEYNTAALRAAMLKN